MKGKITLSPTQLNTLDCPLAWFWSNQKGYVSIRRSVALELGIGVHYALERYYAANKHPVKIFTKWADAQLKLAPWLRTRSGYRSDHRSADTRDRDA